MSQGLLLRRRLAAIAAGALFPLGFAPFHVFPFAIISIAAIFYIWDRCVSPGDAAITGFLWGFAAFQAGLYWLHISVHGYGNAPVWLSLFLMFGTVAIMAAYMAILGYVTHRFLPKSGLARWLVGLPGLWVLAEWFRGWLLSGFGWLAPGYALIDTPLSGFAPAGGILLVSAATALTAGVLVAIFHSGPRAQAVAGIVAAITWLGGFGLTQIDWTEPVGESIRASILQGAVRQDEKWLPEQLRPTIRLYSDMTDDVLDSDLIVWPEAAIPALYRYVEPHIRIIERRTRANGAALLLGIPRELEESGQFANSLVAFADGERTFYDKRHLVPFGEFFPVPRFVREWMRLRNLPYTDYKRGDPKQPPIAAAGQRVAVTICYEDLFGSEQRYGLAETTLLVNVSNDAWFGDSIAPHQHLQIARMRALEAGRPMIRATNTGISAFIGHDGQVRERSPQFAAHTLTRELRGYQGLTPYARFGDWPILLLGLAAAALAVSRRLAA